jgi:uncharacterized small protein (DUF1192 family)
VIYKILNIHETSERIRLISYEFNYESQEKNKKNDGRVSQETKRSTKRIGIRN